MVSLASSDKIKIRFYLDQPISVRRTTRYFRNRVPQYEDAISTENDYTIILRMSASDKEAIEAIIRPLVIYNQFVTTDARVRENFIDKTLTDLLSERAQEKDTLLELNGSLMPNGNVLLDIFKDSLSYRFLKDNLLRKFEDLTVIHLGSESRVGRDNIPVFFLKTSFDSRGLGNVELPLDFFNRWYYSSRYYLPDRTDRDDPTYRQNAEFNWSYEYSRWEDAADGDDNYIGIYENTSYSEDEREYDRGNAGYSDSDSDDSSTTEIIDNSSTTENIDPFQMLMNSLPRMGEPVVGKEYTLDEFRGLQPMGKNVVVMGEADKVDCGLETNVTSKIEPVKVKVQRMRRGRGLRVQYEWDKDGDTLFVFCAADLRRWLTTQVPSYIKMYDINPFNKKEIYAVQYLTEKEAKEQWKIRQREKKIQEKIEKMKEKNRISNPMLKVLEEKIQSIESKLELAKYLDGVSDVSAEVSETKESLQYEIDDLNGRIEDNESGDDYILYKTMLLNSNNDDEKEVAKEELEALEKDTDVLKFQLQKLINYREFIIRIENADARRDEKKLLEQRVQGLKNQYKMIAGHNIPNTKTSGTSSVTQQMSKLKF